MAPFAKDSDWQTTIYTAKECSTRSMKILSKSKKIRHSNNTMLKRYSLLHHSQRARSVRAVSRLRHHPSKCDQTKWGRGASCRMSQLDFKAILTYRMIAANQRRQCVAHGCFDESDETDMEAPCRSLRRFSTKIRAYDHIGAESLNDICLPCCSIVEPQSLFQFVSVYSLERSITSHSTFGMMLSGII